jgi:hypothetical protein
MTEYKSFVSLKSNILLFLVGISGILVMILSSDLDIFCLPIYNRMISISNADLFFIYSIIFTTINILLLIFSKNVKFSNSKMRTILFVVILINQLLISSILFMIYSEIKMISGYHNILFYTIIYASLISSSAFLAIAGFQFLRWFRRGKNYLVMVYGFLMLILSANSIIGIIYMSQVSRSHNSIIHYSSCSGMFGSLHYANPELIGTLSIVFDVVSFISFIFAWLATVIMLKEYSKGKNKFAYWVLVTLPLIFFLSRYEVGAYYFLNNETANILSLININSNVYGYRTFEYLLNLNLQIGGILFGIAFLTMALKLTGRGQQRNALVLIGLGIMFLFGSKSIGSLTISSYPPLGAVSIAFMGLASYMVYLGIYSAATLTARDKDLRRDLHEKIENNLNLLRSISSSQSRMEIEKNVKHLMNISTEWQEENKEVDMTPEEIRTIVKDVISELKASQKRS